MKPCVFIQSNHKQIAGAIVAEHALKRNSQHGDKFNVRIIHHKDYPFFLDKEGKSYLRDGFWRKWRNNDLQSFTLTRFMPPELMHYQGRALCIDPDVFAVTDVWELLSRDMKGKAIMATKPKNKRKEKEGMLASSVLLLDCAKLKHWKVEDQFDAMFDGRIDYIDWISLRNEKRDTIGILEDSWNHFDILNSQTNMVHNTHRRTQPWKSGLKVDFQTPERNRRGHPFAGWLWYMRSRIFGPYAFQGKYQSHPDKRQEQFFFGLVKECVENGTLSEDMIKQQMRYDHIRHDTLDVLKETPSVDTTMAALQRAA